MNMMKKIWPGITFVLILVLALSLLPFAAGAVTTSNIIKMITASPSGAEGDGYSANPLISADGTKVVFDSYSANLIEDVTTTSSGNIFLYDIATGTNTLVTRGPANLGGNGWSGNSRLSADGTKIVFQSSATNLISGVTTTSSSNVFLYDIATGTTTLVTRGPANLGGDNWAGSPWFAANSTKIVFQSSATNLISGVTTTNHANVFLYDIATGTTTLVTRGPANLGGNNWTGTSQPSPDNTKIVLESLATNLISGATTTSSGNIFLYDIATGTTTLVTRGPANLGGNNWSGNSRLSADGTKIVFQSSATNLISGVTTTSSGNIFLYDIATGTTTLVTRGPANLGGDNWSSSPWISADATKILFNSSATNLISGVTTTSSGNIFLYDIATGTTTLVTKGSSGNGTTDGWSSLNYGFPFTSNDTELVFVSAASTLVSGGTVGGYENLYRYNIAAGTTELLTKGPLGVGISEGNTHSYSMTADGNRIAFNGCATDFTDELLTTPWREHIYIMKRVFSVDVTFDAQNGTDPVVETIEQGTAVEAPVQPEREGFAFNGWWTADGVRWDFNNPVNNDMTLTAHWLEVFTVTYDAQNGTAPLAIDAVEGSLLVEPNAPTRAGYTFDGWYTASADGTLWDFALDTVSGSMTLYGQWTPDGEPPVPPVDPKDPTTPAMGDSMNWSIMGAIALGSLVITASFYRKRFEA